MTKYTQADDKALCGFLGIEPDVVDAPAWSVTFPSVLSEPSPDTEQMVVAALNKNHTVRPEYYPDGARCVIFKATRVAARFEDGPQVGVIALAALQLKGVE